MTSLRWLAARQEEAPRGEAWLSTDERAAVARLSVPKRRDDWLLGRWAGKRVLVATGLAPSAEEVSILASASGAPEAFVLGRPAGVALSLTHSHGVAVALLGPAGTRVGVDLERIEERTEGFLADWFTGAEQGFVAASPAEGRALAATLVWSAKEAVMKALREGLRIPPKAVEVTPERGAADGTWRAFEARGPGGEGWGGWWKVEEGNVLSAVGETPSGPPERIG